MCVCACGIEPSSLVNEGGKGLSGKKTRKKISIHALIYIYTYIYTHRYMGGRRPVCSVYIGIYIGMYNGQRKEACVQRALICTAADGSSCIPIYIPIYTNISVYRGRRPVCSVHSYIGC
jgi:hypothetical protein